MLAVITGASSGIGASFARKLARRGYSLLLVSRRESRLCALAQDLRDSSHIKVETLALDLTRDEDVERLAGRIRAESDMGLLVNNAGFGSNGYFEETDPATQTAMHRLHVVAAVALSHAALENLTPKAAAATGVINVSSVAAFGTSPQNVSYCATKTWMNRFTEGLAIELGARGSPVRVQALCPGFTLSEFHDAMRMERSAVPFGLWMTTDFVVEESLRGFDRGQLIVIPGWRYRALVRLMQSVPAAVQRKATIWAVRRYRKKKVTT